MTSLLLLATLGVGCQAGGKDPAGSDSAGGDSAADADNHPLAPDTHEAIWDVDSLTCDDAHVYVLFEGYADADGHLEGRETFYWFHSDEGWDSDCTDTFDVTADIGNVFSEGDDPCLAAMCDRRYIAEWDLDDDARTCNYGYGALFVDDEDRERETYDVSLELDVVWNDGSLNDDMNVFTYFIDGNSYYDQTLRKGTFVPDTAGDYTGPGTMDWELPSGFCVNFR